MIQVNAMGDNCPIPVIKTKKAIEALTGPEVVEVLVDNEVAVQNVTKMAQTLGGSVTSERIAEKEFKIRIQIGDVLRRRGSLYSRSKREYDYRDFF